MTLSAKEYKSTLGSKEAFVIRSLAERGKAVFSLQEAWRVTGREIGACARNSQLPPCPRNSPELGDP
jgi:hypothetical protein